MSWEEQSIERKLRAKLKSKLTVTKADELYSDYTSARTELINNIYPEIKTTEPSLSYHDSSHTINVLNNAEKLLEKDDSDLTPIEFYMLCLCILFHDVGNIEGRQDHQRKISEIYDSVRSKKSRYNDEKRCVMQVVSAHCGDAIDGTKDTLKFVTDEHVYGEKVRTRKIAAIVRLADELAEGVQRTSEYSIDKGKYPDSSIIYHKYAQATSICIDKEGHRIALDYNIILETDDNDSLVFHKSIDINDMLKFIYYRILKLDQERKYTKHYCDWLSNFKETSIKFTFWVNDTMVGLGLNTIVISDLVIPGDAVKAIPEYDKNYEIENVVGALVACIKKGEPESVVLQ